MKVITIKQPFATLIAEGIKEYEFRTWRTMFRGEVLIHAGKSIDRKAMKRYEHLHLNYPTGVIIAKATITDCVEVDEKFIDELLEKDDVVYGGFKEEKNWQGYGFKLENVKKIKPLETNGKLGFWNYEGDICK